MTKTLSAGVKRNKRTFLEMRGVPTVDLVREAVDAFEVVTMGSPPRNNGVMTTSPADGEPCIRSASRLLSALTERSLRVIAAGAMGWLKIPIRRAP